MSQSFFDLSFRNDDKEEWQDAEVQTCRDDREQGMEKPASAKEEIDEGEEEDVGSQLDQPSPEGGHDGHPVDAPSAVNHL